MEPLVSFVIPTLGRPSLRRTLESLAKQSNGDWEALVMVDAKAPSLYATEYEHLGGEISFWYPGVSGSAGLLRNEGVRLAQGMWVAWVDDDDWLDADYVERLSEHIHEKDPDVVVFRMLDERLGVLPRPDGVMTLGTVGISYALRRDVMLNYQFIREDVSGPAEGWKHEDITLLNALKCDGCEIYLSPFITYYVRDAE
jgi:glycosyltransferase involved in cell wall biosynthesis